MRTFADAIVFVVFCMVYDVGLWQSETFSSSIVVSFGHALGGIYLAVGLGEMFADDFGLLSPLSDRAFVVGGIIAIGSTLGAVLMGGCLVTAIFGILVGILLWFPPVAIFTRRQRKRERVLRALAGSGEQL